MIDENGAQRYVLTVKELDELYRKLENFIADCTSDTVDSNREALNTVLTMIHQHKRTIQGKVVFKKNGTNTIDELLQLIPHVVKSSFDGGEYRLEMVSYIDAFGSKGKTWNVRYSSVTGGKNLCQYIGSNLQNLLTWCMNYLIEQKHTDLEGKLLCQQWL